MAQKCRADARRKRRNDEKKLYEDLHRWKVGTVEQKDRDARGDNK